MIVLIYYIMSLMLFKIKQKEGVEVRFLRYIIINCTFILKLARVLLISIRSDMQ